MGVYAWLAHVIHRQFSKDSATWHIDWDVLYLFTGIDLQFEKKTQPCLKSRFKVVESKCPSDVYFQNGGQ